MLKEEIPYRHLGPIDYLVYLQAQNSDLATFGPISLSN